MTFDKAVPVSHIMPSIDVGTGNTYLAGCAQKAYSGTNLAKNKYFLPAGGQYMIAMQSMTGLQLIILVT